MRKKDINIEQLLNKLQESCHGRPLSVDKHRNMRNLIMLEKIPVIIYISSIDEPCNIKYVTPHAAELLGLSENELKQNYNVLFELIHPDDRDCVFADLRKCQISNENFISIYRILTRDEQILWFYNKATVVEDDNDKLKYIQGVMVDITRQKKVEELLKESEERYRLLVELSPDMIALHDKEGKIIYVNQAAASNLGVKNHEELIGKNVFDFIHPQSKRIILERLGQIFIDSKVPFNEEKLIRTDGSVIDVEVAGVLFSKYGEQAVQLVARDITGRKRMEKEIKRLDMLNVVGEMAAAVSHEIRNPLSVVRGFLQLLGEKGCHEHKEKFDLMIEEIDRANTIISEFLSLTKNKIVELQPLNLNSVIESFFPLIQAEALKNDKDIVLELEQIPDLLLDNKEIRQLTLNLVRNGLEAMTPGKRMSIKTYICGNEVVLAVQDSGKGIKPEVLDKIGTPFFTTKDNGNGLGLAVCHRIAERHNAKIDVETGPCGTTFFVRFKRTEPLFFSQ